MKNLRTRKQNRFKNYDYSKNGFYFITMCSKNREHIFGHISAGADGPDMFHGEASVGADGCRPVLNEFGRIVEEELKKSQRLRKKIKVDRYVIMPNHVHCIIVIEQGDLHNTGRQPSNTSRRPSAHTYGKRSLSSFVQGFKSAVTTRINTLRNMPGKPVWQRSFHDRIIGNEQALIAIRKYSANTLKNWKKGIDNLINPKPFLPASILCPALAGGQRFF